MANISAIKLPDGVTYNIKDDVSGYITGMTILSYGSSTWQNFIDAYDANKVVYCRASSNSNPATGSQTRLAFMAYVNNATTPTEVEFQYYRSVSSHSATQQGDQVYIYKLNKSTGWSVTVREAMSKIAAGGDLTSSYANGTITISGDIPDVPSWALQSSKPSYSASEISGAVYADGAHSSGGVIYSYGVHGLGNGIIEIPVYSSTITNDDQVTTKKYVDDAIGAISIPTKVSDLTNDSGFITTETDPTVPAWAKANTKPTYTAAEVDAVATSAVGAANGVAPLDTNGLIASAYLPSYVDDVLEYATRAGFPAMGETGKIYVDTDTNKTYRWGGSEYVEISASLALGKTSSTAAPGNHTHSVSITPSTASVYSITSLGTANTPTQIDTTKFSGGSLTMTINGTDSSQLDITFTAAATQSGFYTAGTAATMPTRSQVTGLWNGYTSATAQAIQ